MKILAISGSVRSESTNTYFLREIAYISSETNSDVQIEIFNSHDELPIFSQDLEGEETPLSVLTLCKRISLSDGIIISSPEYIKSIPGGLKNTIDWLVSRDEIIKKPIALTHASHRGEDVLITLRRILSTISENFSDSIFLKVPLIGKNADEVKMIVNSKEFKPQVNRYISKYTKYIESVSGG